MGLVSGLSIIPGATIVLAGVTVFNISLHSEPIIYGDMGAKVFPFTAAILLISSGLVMSFANHKNESAKGTSCCEILRVYFRILLIFIASIVYLIGLKAFGYLAATTIAIPIMSALFGVRSKVYLILATLISPVIYYLLFFHAFDVLPIEGELFDFEKLFRMRR